MGEEKLDEALGKRAQEPAVRPDHRYPLARAQPLQVVSQRRFAVLGHLQTVELLLHAAAAGAELVGEALPLIKGGQGSDVRRDRRGPADRILTAVVLDRANMAALEDFLAGLAGRSEHRSRTRKSGGVDHLLREQPKPHGLPQLPGSWSARNVRNGRERQLPRDRRAVEVAGDGVVPRGNGPDGSSARGPVQRRLAAADQGAAGGVTPCGEPHANEKMR